MRGQLFQLLFEEYRKIADDNPIFSPLYEYAAQNYPELKSPLDIYEFYSYNMSKTGKKIDPVLSLAIKEYRENLPKASIVFPEINEISSLIGRTLAYLSLIAQSRIMYLAEKLKKGSLKGSHQSETESWVVTMDKNFEFSEEYAQAAKEKYLSWLDLSEEKPKLAE